VDMDLSDGGGNAIPEEELGSGNQALDLSDNAQTGCQDQGIDLTGAELTSTVNSSVALATATSQLSQASLISDIPGQQEVLTHTLIAHLSLTRC
jgi:hypothetical protein